MARGLPEVRSGWVPSCKNVEFIAVTCKIPAKDTCQYLAEDVPMFPWLPYCIRDNASDSLRQILRSLTFDFTT